MRDPERLLVAVAVRVVHPLAGADEPDWTASLVASATHARVCDVRVELDERISEDEVRADLAADPAHWLSEFSPDIAAVADGRTGVGLTIPGSDVWTAALTAMAVLRRSGYDLHSLHVTCTEPSSVP